MKAVDCSRVENHVEGQQKQLMDTEASAQHRSRNSKACECVCVCVCVCARAHVCALLPHLLLSPTADSRAMDRPHPGG